MKNYKTLFYCCILFLLSIPLHAQLSEESTISILTCRPGDDVYNIFGHNAVRVQDSSVGVDEVYNYGLFSFEEEGFVMKFLRGKLRYWVGRSSMKGFLRGYVHEKRSVIEQTLDLDLAQKNKLYRALVENQKPENRYYLYDFFYDNCATRIRDILTDNITLLEYTSIDSEQYSFRQLLDQFNYKSPWIDFGMDLLVGTPADKTASPQAQMYLPEYLFNNLEKASLAHKPLVKSTQLILDYEAEIATRSRVPFFTPTLLFGLLLLLELFFFLKAGKEKLKWLSHYDNLAFLLLGIGSMILVFMWFGTDHSTTKNNLNLLWMSPLFLCILFYKSKNLILVQMGFIVLCLLLGTFVQQLHVAAILIALIAFFKLLRIFRSTRQIDVKRAA